jgi:hypothetical protein
MSNSNSGRIVAELRWGSLQGTLWANATKNGEVLSLTVRRGFRRGEDAEWEESKMNIPHRQLLEVAELIRQLHSKGWDHLSRERVEGDSAETDD